MTSPVQKKYSPYIDDIPPDRKGGAPDIISPQLVERVIHPFGGVPMPSFPLIPKRVSVCSPSLELPQTDSQQLLFSVLDQDLLAGDSLAQPLVDLPLPSHSSASAAAVALIERDPYTTPPSSPKRHDSQFLTPNRAELLRNPLPKDTPSRVKYPQESRPLWWNDAYRTIRDLSLLNRSERILEQRETLREIIEQVKGSDNPKEHLMLLKLFSEFMFYGASDSYFDVMKNLIKLIPDLSEFLFEDPYGEPEDGFMISPSGMGKVIEYFEAEFGYPSGALSCLNVTSLPERILDLASQGQSGEFRGWVVSNDLDAFDPHVVPVFAQKIDGLVHVFIFDSMGHGSVVSKSLEHLIEVFKDDPSACSKLVLHSYLNKRQNSPLVCWVFSLLDLKALLERSLHQGESLLHFYQAQKGDLALKPIGSDLCAGDLQVFALNTLPPEMMKSTQSLTEIGRYRKSSIEWDSKMASTSARFSFDGSEVQEMQDFDSMYAKVQSCSFLSSSEKPQNLYVEKKRLTYMLYLVCSLMRSNLDAI